MADIKGDEITIVAAERIDKAIEQVGSTSSIDHVGKGLQYGSAGVELANANTKPAKFAGVVKAVGADAEPEFQSTRVIDNFVAGRNSTDMPYFHGSVSVPKGVDVTVERNLMTYVLTDGNVKFGDLITTDADGKFVTTTTYADAVGRAHSDSDSNKVAYVYIRGM